MATDNSSTINGDIELGNMDSADYYSNLTNLVNKTYENNVNSTDTTSNNNAGDLELLLQRNRDFSFGPISKTTNNSTIQTADKNTNLWGFIQMVNKLVDTTMKDLNAKFIPDEGKQNVLEPIQPFDAPYITYKIKSRKPKGEIKARYRQEISDTSDGETRLGDIYGQKFECFVQFNFFAHGYNEVEELMDRFEDMMTTYTGYLKRNGVAELLFYEQLTDDDFNIFRQEISVRNLIYRVEIEKLTVIFKEKIKDIEIILNQKEA